MMPKIIGAVLIFVSCGGMGLSIAANHRSRERMLQQIITAVEFMVCELEYRQTPLPDLLKLCASHTGGLIGRLFSQLSRELEQQIAPDAACCMEAVLREESRLPGQIIEKFQLLGKTLGRFDLNGQVSGLRAVAELSKRDLDGLLLNREARLRGYTTLGLCAGAAIVILFI